MVVPSYLDTLTKSAVVGRIEGGDPNGETVYHFRLISASSECGQLWKLDLHKAG